jgi:hypothetical protein
MTVLVSTNWTGNNGDPWPSPWSTGLLGGTTGGGIDIQINRGRMRARDGDYNIARADVTGITVDNGVIQGLIRFPAVAEHYVYMWVRSGGWSASESSLKSNGYYFFMRSVNQPNNDIFSLGKYVNGTNTWLSQHLLATPYGAGEDYSFKFDLNANVIQGKFWNAFTTEPAAWLVSATDNSHSSGGVAISLVSGSSSGTREALFDNFTVTSTTQLEVQPSNWTGYQQAITANNPESPDRQFFRYDGTDLIPVDMYVGGP